MKLTDWEVLWGFFFPRVTPETIPKWLIAKHSWLRFEYPVFKVRRLLPARQIPEPVTMNLPDFSTESLKVTAGRSRNQIVLVLEHIRLLKRFTRAHRRSADGLVRIPGGDARGRAPYPSAKPSRHENPRQIDRISRVAVQRFASLALTLIFRLCDFRRVCEQVFR